MPEIIITACC